MGEFFSTSTEFTSGPSQSAGVLSHGNGEHICRAGGIPSSVHIRSFQCKSLANFYHVALPFQLRGTGSI
jgi:hypothetical protein